MQTNDEVKFHYQSHESVCVIFLTLWKKSRRSVIINIFIDIKPCFCLAKVKDTVQHFLK